jgi:fido (protein-threonine AMPylation protein)
MTDSALGPADATPLTDAERHGLLLPVQSRAELNRMEADGITAAMSWLILSRRRIRPAAVTDEGWLKRLHKRMYGNVWDWAGKYRSSDRNLGVPYWQVPADMRDLLADARVAGRHLRHRLRTGRVRDPLRVPAGGHTPLPER